MNSWILTLLSRKPFDPGSDFRGVEILKKKFFNTSFNIFRILSWLLLQMYWKKSGTSKTCKFILLHAAKNTVNSTAVIFFIYGFFYHEYHDIDRVLLKELFHLLTKIWSKVDLTLYKSKKSKTIIFFLKSIRVIQRLLLLFWFHDEGGSIMRLPKNEPY